MPFSLFFQNPFFFLVWVIAILIALTIHEFMHAFAGYSLGDSTAKRLGRLTLNPLAHIDWIGFFALIFVGFGWGKPVPFNPYNLRYPKWGPTLVAFAGPLANLIGVIVFGLAHKSISSTGILPSENLLVQFLLLLVVLNLILFIFNLIPIPPLDGSKLLFSLFSSPRFHEFRERLETRGPLILLAFIILDSLTGTRILASLFQAVISFTLQLF